MCVYAFKYITRMPLPPARTAVAQKTRVPVL